MKRRWSETAVEAVEGGHALCLDGRALLTPAEAPLVLPTRAIAEAVAAEFRAQGARIDSRGMPMARAVMTAIDRVAPARDQVVATVAAYGESDLICYRAGHPAELVRRQAAGWDPWIVWARDRHGAGLMLGEGVVPIRQPERAVARLRAAVARHDAFGLVGLHDLTALGGSLVLALAVAEGALEAESAWALSRIDETWQVDLWGRDDEAEAAAEARRGAFLDAARLLRLIAG